MSHRVHRFHLPSWLSRTGSSGKKDDSLGEMARLMARMHAAKMLAKQGWGYFPAGYFGDAWVSSAVRNLVKL